MNLDELRSVQSKERQTDSLQHLRESFYADVSAYISDLEDERDRAAGEADDPFADPEVRRLTDEIETAREVVEAIYDRRLGKLVKRASLAAADMPADEDGLTAEERELFEDLVDRIEASKAEVLDVLDADHGGVPTADAEAAAAPERPQADGTPPSEVGREGRGAESATDGEPAGEAVTDAGAPEETPAPGDAPPEQAADAGADGAADAGADGASDHGSATGGDGEPMEARTTVRVTGDVDEFYGVDQREYDLDREDVVTLPAENAEPLVESGDAERLD